MNNTELIIIKEALSRFSRFENEEIYKSVQQIEPMSQPLRDKLDDSVSELYAANNRAFTFRKAIAILVAATLLIACLSMGVYAIAERTKIGGFFVELFGKDVKLSTDVTPEDDISLENVQISYVTQGFINTKSNVQSQFAVYEWSKDDSKIYLRFSIYRNGNITLDNESGKYSVVDVGNRTVHRVEYPEEIFVLWIEGAITYKLQCTNLPWEEMVKIIEGISYAE